MKVQVDICDTTHGCRYYLKVEDWDTCETAIDVYKAAIKLYGRCISKIYVDKNGKSEHIGWVFKKQAKYEDVNETYLRETWITPLSKYEIKHIIEYALQAD